MFQILNQDEIHCAFGFVFHDNTILFRVCLVKHHYCHLQHQYQDLTFVIY